MLANYSRLVYNTSNSVYITDIAKEILMERLMTTEEVAELLRIDAVTVRRLITRGELTAYRVAGEYRFTPADLEKFLEGQRVVVDTRSKNLSGDKFTDQARRVLSM